MEASSKDHSGKPAQEKRLRGGRGVDRILAAIASRAAVRWILVLALSLLAGFIGVAIALQGPRLSPMQLLVGFAFDAPIVAAVIALLWYGRILGRATADRIAAEARFSELITSAPDGIFVLGANARILDANPAAEALLGRRRDDLIGRSLTDFVPPDRATIALHYLADRIAGRRAGELYDGIFLRGDGTSVPVQITSRVLRAAGGEPSLVYFARDVTGSREMQRKLLESERWASMGRLASYVAHEINTPLTNISLLNASIGRRASDPEVQERVRKVGTQVKIAANITRELLKFARAGPIEPVETDLTEIVQTAIEHAEAFRKPTTNLRPELEMGPVPARVDPVRIQEVVVNLLKNAYDATPNGIVIVRLEDRGDRHAIVVSDNGVGIPPEVQPRLFEAFFTTKKKGEGTGLGLAISRNFVVAHGGEISVVSEPRIGSTFEVLLPKRAPAGDLADEDALASPSFVKKS